MQGRVGAVWLSGTSRKLKPSAPGSHQQVQGWLGDMTHFDVKHLPNPKQQPWLSLLSPSSHTPFLKQQKKNRLQFKILQAELVVLQVYIF